MHVFIDTNILLVCFHFTNDELDALNDVFASHEHGSAKVLLTEQVRNEFTRNRENKIQDALKRFNEVKFSPQLPSFMKAYPEHRDITRLAKELRGHQKTILQKANDDIMARKLPADRLILDIFESSGVTPVDDSVFQRGQMRVGLGNPPKKKKDDSLGDAINWILLLQSVPEGEDVHVISGDGDFYSVLDEGRP